MPEQTNQREKATEVVNVRLTPSVAEKIQHAANETFNGNVSGWVKHQIERAIEPVRKQGR